MAATWSGGAAGESGIGWPGGGRPTPPAALLARRGLRRTRQCDCLPSEHDDCPVFPGGKGLTVPVLRTAALSGALLLAACGGAGPRAGHRDPGVMIASAALFDPARFAGTWHVVADFPFPGAARCGITREDWRVTGPGRFAVAGSACGPRGVQGFAASAAVTGPGRIDLAADGRPDLGTDPLWVLWIDADDRVAAIGTPSGRFGMILSRSPAARGDLLAAAREALDFNGYALEGLQPRQAPMSPSLPPGPRQQSR